MLDVWGVGMYVCCLSTLLGGSRGEHEGKRKRGEGETGEVVSNVYSKVGLEGRKDDPLREENSTGCVKLLETRVRQSDMIRFPCLREGGERALNSKNRV